MAVLQKFCAVIEHIQNVHFFPCMRVNVDIIRAVLLTLKLIRKHFRRFAKGYERKATL